MGKDSDLKGEMMTDLKRCPFCGGTDIYETYSQEYAFGTKNPEIFCNSCKAIFSIEDDSPYMNCEEDYAYRKQKTKEAWNRRYEPSEPEHTMEEFMYGQDMGNPEDGSL